MEGYDDRMYEPTAEMAVLACCLRSKVARDKSAQELTGLDFYLPVNQAIWEAMQRLHRQGMEVDGPAVLGATHSDWRQRAQQILVDLPGYPVVLEAIPTHCHKVREKAQLRRVYAEAQRTVQLCLNPDVDPLGLAAAAVTRYASIRDDGLMLGEDMETMTVEELMLEVDPDPDWVIPGFLERADRFILTGEEGLGKSHLLRQIVILASAGLDPFRPWNRIEPVRGMIIDFENSKRQVRRRLAQVYDYALRGKGAPGLAGVLPMQRADITSDRVLNKIHRELDVMQPDILVIGPLYRMSPTAIKDDSDASPILSALDTIRDRGISVLIEAHAGHTTTSGGQGRTRDLRPRGSSALLGWPEFGYGMKGSEDGKNAVLVPWRGDRDVRNFPLGLTSRDGMWVEARPLTIREAHEGREDWGGLAEEHTD